MASTSVMCSVRANHSFNPPLTRAHSCDAGFPDPNPLALETSIADMCRRVNEESVLAVQIFDQKKFKKKDQGFLGVINVRIGSVIDLDAGGDGTLSL
jgi:hypothetical protein